MLKFTHKGRRVRFILTGTSPDCVPLVIYICVWCHRFVLFEIYSTLKSLF